MAQHTSNQLLRFKKRLRALLAMPFFWAFTAAVNGFALVSAIFFHHLESATNPNIQSFLDSLSWSVGLITTIGYGNVMPITTAGKTLSLFMMAGGSIVIWLYMALFVSALMSPELNRIESEISDVEKELKHMREDSDKANT
jgi:voltage-gated potassium channel